MVINLEKYLRKSKLLQTNNRFETKVGKISVKMVGENEEPILINEKELQ